MIGASLDRIHPVLGGIWRVKWVALFTFFVVARGLNVIMNGPSEPGALRDLIWSLVLLTLAVRLRLRPLMVRARIRRRFPWLGDLLPRRIRSLLA